MDDSIRIQKRRADEELIIRSTCCQIMPPLPAKNAGYRPVNQAPRNRRKPADERKILLFGGRITVTLSQLFYAYLAALLVWVAHKRGYF
jgi:hypothetical protein